MHLYGLQVGQNGLTLSAHEKQLNEAEIMY